MSLSPLLPFQQREAYNLTDLESDRLSLERLASQRQELLQQISALNNNNHENKHGSWIATPRGGSSFLMVQNEQAKAFISIQIKTIEEDIQKVCLRIQEYSRNGDSSRKY